MNDKSENRTCQNCTQNFNIESEDFAFYAKLGVPAPTWCPHCRFIRKLTYINERSLYKRNCGLCKIPIISMYHADTSIPVYCVKCHISDQWDARDYGRDYDFSRNFFEQFAELKKVTPSRALDQNEKNVACEYSNYCFRSKNNYLTFQTTTSENIMYSRFVFKHNKNCLDSLNIKENDRGYELVQASENYNSSFLVESDQCIDSQFLYDCSNCVNCFMSSNLRNKSYVFRNKQLSKDEYKKAIEEARLGTYSGQVSAKKEFGEMVKNAIHKYAHIKNSVNVVAADFVENSKNISNSYGLVNAENVKNMFMGVKKIEDCQDTVFTGGLSECYEITNAGRGGNRIVFSISCGGGSKNVFYCDSCRGCSDCFGCEGLDKKQYCILNKQYSKDEYFDLLEKIKQHMSDMPYVDKTGREYSFGEFFPTAFSPFAYNETIAFEENYLSKDQILSKGYRWRDPEVKNYAATTQSTDLPDGINDIQDSICEEIIACPNKGNVETLCTSAFKILPEELVFYRQMNLPVPRYCPNCRYHERLVWKNPFKFYQRKCMCDLAGHTHAGECPNEFETMYSPERPEMIYCKECYQKEVY